MSVFDIVGPVMIGPSSSHTAGAARIGLMARNILKDEPVKAMITVYGSFAKTYKGHGTDKALVAGLLGFSADDTRLRDSFSIAAEKGLEITLRRSDEEVDHPNTVRIAMTGKNGNQAEILGVSLGGGKIEIREINGKHANAVMIVCTDSPVPAEMVSLIGNISAIESVITLAPL